MLNQNYKIDYRINYNIECFPAFLSAEIYASFLISKKRRSLDLELSDGLRETANVLIQQHEFSHPLFLSTF
jgi:hypothetical protein